MEFAWQENDFFFFWLKKSRNVFAVTVSSCWWDYNYLYTSKPFFFALTFITIFCFCFLKVYGWFGKKKNRLKVDEWSWIHVKWQIFLCCCFFGVCRFFWKNIKTWNQWRCVSFKMYVSRIFIKKKNQMNIFDLEIFFST